MKEVFEEMRSSSYINFIQINYYSEPCLEIPATPMFPSLYKADRHAYRNFSFGTKVPLFLAL